MTVYFLSQATGQLPVPPLVVHQAAEMNASLALNLPLNWAVHCSPSGYMDEDGWMKQARHMLASLPAPRPLFHIVDGHKSHWNVDALQLLLDNEIHTVFLRSNNSVNDQVNDNGHVNSALHGCYGEVLEGWRQRYSAVVDITPPYANMVLAEAFSTFTQKCGASIVKAYKETGLFPLNRNAANHKRGTHLAALPFYVPTAMVAAAEAPPAVAAGEAGRRRRQPPPQAVEAPPAEETLEWYKLENVRLTAQVAELEAAVARGYARVMVNPAELPAGAAGPSSEQATAVVLRTAAWASFTKSHIVPAQQLAKELELHSKAKKSKPSRCDPTDTRTGAIATQDVLDACREADAEKAAEAAEVAERAGKRKAEQELRDGQRAVVGADTLGKLRALTSAAERTAAVNKLKVEELRAALKGLGEKTKDGTTKKELLLPALRAAVLDKLAPLPAPAAGAGAASPADAAAAGAP